MYDQAIWGWSALHSHAPALKQLLLSSQLVQQLQQEYCVPVSKLLDSVFGGAGGGAGSAGSGSNSWEAGELAVKHLEYWPWVNPYCRPIVHSKWSLRTLACKWQPPRCHAYSCMRWLASAGHPLVQTDLLQCLCMVSPQAAVQRFRGI